MAKKLSIFEHGARIAQKRRLADHNARLRQKEREQRMKEREHIKKKALQEREYEKSREKQRKENQKRREELEKLDQLKQLNYEVSQFKAYLNGINSFHKNPQLLTADNNFDQRLKVRTWEKNSFSHSPIQKKHLLDLENIKAYGYQFINQEFKPSYEFESWKEAFFKENTGALLSISLVLALLLPTALFAYFYRTYSLLTASIVGLLALIILLSILGSIIERKAKKRYEAFISSERDAFNKDEEVRRNRYTLLLKEVKAELQQELVKFFDEQESKNNEIFDANEKERLSILNDVKSGSNLDSYYQMLEAILPLDLDVVPPDENTSTQVFDYEVGYYVEEIGKIKLSIVLPDFSIIPETGIEMSPSGKKISEYAISDKVRRELYSDFVVSLSYRHAIEVIKNIPSADNIFIECCYTGYSEVTGKDSKVLLLQISIDKENFVKLDFERISLVPSLKNFEHTFNILGGKTNKEIESLLDDEKLVWATKDDEGYILPFGLLDGQNDLVLPNQFGSEPINFELFSSGARDKLKKLKEIALEGNVITDENKL